MTTYICKCGRTFQKNTGAGTTGFRMPDYGPEHECYGCPFALEIMTWDPVTQQQAVQNHECRGSKTIRYDTTAGINITDKTVADILTLDFDFLRQIREFARFLDGFDSEHGNNGDFCNSPSCYSPDGRFRYPLYPEQNQKGIAAKAALKEHFFNQDGTRKDVTPEQEKVIVLDQIETAKKEAQSMNKPESAAETRQDISSDVDSFSGTKYLNGGRVYSVGPCDDGKYRTFFYFAVDPTQTQPCCNIPKSDTPEIAQKMLDNYAAKHDFEVFTELTSEADVPLSSEQSSDDTPADAAGEAESADAGEQEQDETPDSENDILDSDNNSDSVENDMPETQDGPCDWKNASGADEDEDEPEEPESSIPVGEPFSLLDDSLTNLINIFDGSINEALRVAVKAKQGFTFQAKITFDYRGGAFAIKHDEQYQFDPIKVKTKGELSEEIQIVLDEDGIPIIPYDRQHQLNFNELQPGREIPPTPVKTTVDGNTGLVESVDGGDPKVVPEDPPVCDDTAIEVVDADLADGETEQLLPPCDHEDCPFHGAADNGCTGCCFDTEDPDDVNYAGDVWTAVHMESCQRPEVLEAYQKNNPEEDYDGSEGPDDLGDLPFEIPENNEEEYAS